MPRLRGLYHNHYSDMSNDSGAPIGSIMAVLVGAHDDGDSTTASKVEHNYPGWLYCDGQQLNISDFPLLYDVLTNKYGGTSSQTVNLRDWGDASQLTGTFNLPDMRMKRVNGPGGIDGAGSITPDLSNMEVGNTGGEWYISRARQLEEYGFGTVRISGYSAVTGFVKGTLSGQAVIQIGPLQAVTLSGPPPHTHLVMGSEAGTFQYQKGTASDLSASPNYVTNRSPVQQWVPEEQGFSAEHSHYITEYRPRRGIDPGAAQQAQYSYDVSPTYAHEFTGGTALPAVGQVSWTSPGTYSWTAPAGVTSICVVCVGGGAGGTGNSAVGGGGGGLGWINNKNVTPGSSYTVVVGAGGTGTNAQFPTSWPVGGDSYFISAATVKGGGGGISGSDSNSGGTFTGDGGGNGGEGTNLGAGGGAGGYSGDGGGGTTSTGGGGGTVVDGNGDGGGGGAGSHTIMTGGGSGGGGVGLNGESISGNRGNPANQTTEGGTMTGGGGGSGGAAGSDATAPYVHTRQWVLAHPTTNTNAYWSTFMQQYGICKQRPGDLNNVDPYLNQPTEGQTLVNITTTTQMWIRVQCDDVADVYWDGVKKNTSPINDGINDTDIDLGTIAPGTYRFKWVLTNTGTQNFNLNPGGIAWQLSSQQGGLGTVFRTSQDAIGGQTGDTHSPVQGGNGGAVGGGGGSCYNNSVDLQQPAGNGGSGGVRIIWGAGRAFPATLTVDQSEVDGSDPGTSDAYSNVYGKNKMNENVQNDNGQTVSYLIDKTLTATPAQAAMTVNDGTLTMTGAEQLTVSAGIVPRTPVPLVLKYFRVKYLIKAW